MECWWQMHTSSQTETWASIPKTFTEWLHWAAVLYPMWSASCDISNILIQSGRPIWAEHLLATTAAAALLTAHCLFLLSSPLPPQGFPVGFWQRRKYCSLFTPIFGKKKSYIYSFTFLHIPMLIAVDAGTAVKCICSNDLEEVMRHTHSHSYQGLRCYWLFFVHNMSSEWRVVNRNYGCLCEHL